MTRGIIDSKIKFDGCKNMASALNSWKEIAVYLNRGVRTVQRWEAENRLPVHRIGSGPKSPVFAYKEELRVWLQQFTIVRAGEAVVLVPVPSQPETSNVELERHCKLRTETQRLLAIQKARFSALLNTVTEIEKNARSSGRPTFRNDTAKTPHAFGLPLRSSSFKVEGLYETARVH